ncbi:MAG: hypothetical protein ABI766_09380 [Gemmatimonadales bacterium]
MSFWICGLLLLVPIWVPTYLPSEDGLGHMYWAEVYRALGNPDSLYGAFFIRHVSLGAPHQLLQFVLQYGLAAVIDAHVAQQVVVSIVVLSWVGAIHYLSRAVNGAITLGGFAALLLVLNCWLYNGFFAFLGAMPFVLVTLGLLYQLGTRPPDDDSIRPYLAIAVFGLAAYYAHFFVGALFLMLVGAWLIYPWRTVRFHRAYLAATMLPTAIQAVWYLGRGTLGSGGMQWESPIRIAARFFGLAFFRGFAAPTPSFWMALSVFAILLACLCWNELRAAPFRDLPEPRRFILAFSGILAVGYFFIPLSIGETTPVHGRVNFAMWAWLLPTLAVPVSARGRKMIVAVVGLLLAWQIVTFTNRSIHFSREYAEVLRQAEAIPAGATLQSSLLYGNARYDGSFVRVLADVPEDIAFRRQAVLLSSFFPSTPYYWVLPKPGVAPHPEYRLDLQRGAAGEMKLVIDRVR